MLTAHDQLALTSVARNNIAPGHRYDPRSGSGIEWTTARARLWLHHEMIAEAPAAGSMWDFWYQLRFVEAFPQVKHWWFGSPWTGRVRLWAPSTMLGGVVAGLMQFVDDSFPAMVWTVQPGSPPQIATPMPPLHAHVINLPLRSVLASYAAGIINGHAAPGEWRVVSSLVASEELTAAFPTGSLCWSLEGTRLPLREQLCRLQGMTRQ